MVLFYSLLGVALAATVGVQGLPVPDNLGAIELP